jgi:DNA-binding transcriptional LysR family regulator
MAKLMDLQRLERFAILAQEQNYSRAAERLSIPQPHLSRQMQQLEQEIGVKLLNRKRRPLELTQAGLAFLAEVEQILAQVNQAKLAAQRANRGEIGHLAVGINNSIANSLLPKILQQFRQQFPGVQLSLHEMLMTESRQKLQHRELDLDFENVYNLQDVDSHHCLTFEVIHREPLLVVLPESHPLSDRPYISLQDLRHDPFVLPCPKSVPALDHLIQILFAQAKIRPPVAQVATWMPTILSLVAGGLGVALLPANATSLQRVGVVYRPIQDDSPWFEIAVVWRRDNTAQPLLNFLDVVRQVSLNPPQLPNLRKA